MTELHLSNNFLIASCIFSSSAILSEISVNSLLRNVWSDVFLRSVTLTFLAILKKAMVLCLVVFNVFYIAFSLFVFFALIDLYEATRRLAAFSFRTSFCYSREDRSKAFCSPEEKEKRLVRVTVNMETRKSPQRATIVPMKRPTLLLG